MNFLFDIKVSVTNRYFNSNDAKGLGLTYDDVQQRFSDAIRLVIRETLITPIKGDYIQPLEGECDNSLLEGKITYRKFSTQEKIIKFIID